MWIFAAPVLPMSYEIPCGEIAAVNQSRRNPVEGSMDEFRWWRSCFGRMLGEVYFAQQAWARWRNLLAHRHIGSSRLHSASPRSRGFLTLMPRRRWRLVHVCLRTVWRRPLRCMKPGEPMLSWDTDGFSTRWKQREQGSGDPFRWSRESFNTKATHTIQTMPIHTFSAHMNALK